MCVVSKVDEFTSQYTDPVDLWLDAINPLVIKLKRCVEVMCSRATVGLTFFALQVTNLTFIANPHTLIILIAGNKSVIAL